MTKTTYRYDESFTIPADATAWNVINAFTKAIQAIRDSGADIDWANLEVSSERYEDSTWSSTTEYTTVSLTARGRK